MGGYREAPRSFRWPWRSRAAILTEVDEEIAFHLEMRVERLIRAGSTDAEAREQALREFGDAAELRRSLQREDEGLERTRSRRRWWQDLLQDARLGTRRLRGSPAFTAIGVATLALGIGASVATFTVVNAVLLRPLPYPEPDRLVRISPGQNFNIALADAVGAAPSLESSTGISLWGLTLTGRGDPVVLNTQMVDGAYFRVFGVQPRIGRPFGPDERESSRSDVVILSHSLWQGRFGGDPAIVGQRVEMDGAGQTEREVIGVMPPDFEPLHTGRKDVDAWAPLSRASARTLATDSTWYVNWVVGRLRPGATVEGAAAEVRTIMERLRAEFTGVIPDESVATAGAAELRDSIVGDVRRALWMLLSAVGVVLLLGCANLGNLFLARSERRRQELAVRAALGGSRTRLIRELLTEGAVLAVLGGVAGVLLAQGILAVLRVTDASGLPRSAELAMDLRVVGFALAVSLLSALLFGMLPAVRASGGDLRPELGSGGRTHGYTRSGRRLGAGLIVVEVALAMVLVTGAGLLLNSLRALRSVDPGLDATDVLALSLSPHPAVHGGEDAARYYQRVEERLRALPGVQQVGAIHLLPFTTGNWAFPYLAEGHEPPADGPLPAANFRVVTPGYFDAVDLPLLSGTGFTGAESGDQPTVGLINRTLAQQLWPGESAIGKTIRIFGSNPFEVVGVVGDARQHALDVPAEPEIYLPLPQWPLSAMTLMVEADVPPASLVAAAREAVWEIDRDVPITEARPLEEVLGDTMRQRRFFANLLTFFGALALLLGAVGVYGVMVQMVSARVPEFGVRLALGAAPGDIVRAAIGAGLLPVALGIALGLAGAAAATRLLTGLLYGIGERDPLTLAAAALILGAAAALASWVPARRASRVDPAQVLKGG